MNKYAYVLFICAHMYTHRQERLITEDEMSANPEAAGASPASVSPAPVPRGRGGQFWFGLFCLFICFVVLKKKMLQIWKKK